MLSENAAKLNLGCRGLQRELFRGPIAAISYIGRALTIITTLHGSLQQSLLDVTLRFVTSGHKEDHRKRPCCSRAKAARKSCLR